MSSKKCRCSEIDLPEGYKLLMNSMNEYDNSVEIICEPSQPTPPVQLRSDKDVAHELYLNTTIGLQRS
jgi:hypothetical protein